MKTKISFLALVGLLALVSGSRIPLEPPLQKFVPKHQPEGVVDAPEDNPIFTDQSAPWENLNATRVSTKDVDMCNCGQQSSGRIIGGTEASQGEVPWRVAVVTLHWNSTSDHDEVSICGGTIISARWVLTAQHCFDGKDVKGVFVYAGEVKHTSATAIIAKLVPANYDHKTQLNDMALLKLRKELDFSNPRIGPACLPYKWKGQTEWTGKVLASGWGKQYENATETTTIMRKVILDVIGNRQCQQYIDRLNTVDRYQLSSSQLCTLTDGADTCQGDSGGSIDAQIDGRWYAFGVVSFGWGCAQPKSPGVYTRVSEILSWIETSTGENYCKK